MPSSPVPPASFPVCLAMLAASGCGCPATPEPASSEPRPRAEQPAPDASVAGERWVGSAPAGVLFTRSEVTVSQYRACVEDEGCTPPAAGDGCNHGLPDRDDHPVNCIDWEQARSVCEWLRGRLPTEEEWYAEASAGGEREHPWGEGEVDCERAVWGGGQPGCGAGATSPVCSRSSGSSVSGLCDMSGNVWEWTATSWYDGAVVLRGGSWNSADPDRLRAAARTGDDPARRHPGYGVRCVR